eukprot:CAMPEP_0170493400 /NCGR_PEP_ID=MMETSP0208-20121228/13840_1 /TAXON_ID=197538 /ORGANISM="Strombidium inclinatum, Strain S3" /LENGTH=130 /DNA_ID=CAMNT_0010769327 /DNA_START=267 /DNA_END=661 /DNA_ORIENTATION=-
MAQAEASPTEESSRIGNRRPALGETLKFSFVNDPELELRSDYEFDNHAIYKGQWRGNFREGFGEQTWPDGAKYEGYWDNNKAHGKGRFFHSDGDVYEGDWFEDKAHGFGIYIHLNGARYEGSWKDDQQDG